MKMASESNSECSTSDDEEEVIQPHKLRKVSFSTKCKYMYIYSTYINRLIREQKNRECISRGIGRHGKKSII